MKLFAKPIGLAASFCLAAVVFLNGARPARPGRLYAAPRFAPWGPLPGEVQSAFDVAVAAFADLKRVLDVGLGQRFVEGLRARADEVVVLADAHPQQLQLLIGCCIKTGKFSAKILQIHTA